MVNGVHPPAAVATRIVSAPAMARLARLAVTALTLLSGRAAFGAMPLAPVWDQASGVGAPTQAERSAASNRAAADGERRTTAAVKAQIRRESENIERQDLASELARLGMSLRWQDHTLGDLADWRARIVAAQTLRAQYGVQVDWRASSLPELTDMRLRAAKASELSSAYGVTVDWQRYTWAALESLRRELARLPGLDSTSDSALAEDALAQPGISRGWRGARAFRAKDPDGLMSPTFAFDTPLVWSRHPGQASRWDHDALLVPTFVSVPPPTRGPDDILDPWRRPFGGAPFGADGPPSGSGR